ncbi:hypothetical protein Cob_v005057 [Colletotrichum orbiculare MAFF 240422]|uniref:Uncharacterized protein n=1 Tax=Colletotrichum orbiculare (strain 104-T / ATCC 96160 / CBS 514.97 / LARS 414 / MAFF 240422) TaxID=1213857 RepID=A0A484FW07_COLOR|nr:hypothetical protein Cob_v005057 [Colletotrichum orbiculare MAFF 240422]
MWNFQVPQGEIRKEKDSVRKIRPAKTPLASGREVMDNFHSDAILHERLTLQPFILPGLFQNGRISSPKPVEELAYNSMASLTRPSSQLQYRQRQNQSRAKERKQRRGPTSEISSTGIQARKSFLSLGDNVAQYWQLDDDMPGDGDHVVRDRESGHEICSAHAYENPRGYNKATALPPESIADYISSAEREILGADYDVYIQGGPDYQGSCEQHGEHADVPDVHG